MKLSVELQRLAPAGMEFVQESGESWRLFDIVKLPNGSRTPTDYSWLDQADSVESYIAFADKNVQIPHSEAIIFVDLTLLARVTAAKTRFCSAALWRDMVWGFSACQETDPKINDVRFRNCWTIEVFENTLSPADKIIYRTALSKKPSGSIVIQVARKI